MTKKVYLRLNGASGGDPGCNIFYGVAIDENGNQVAYHASSSLEMLAYDLKRDTNKVLDINDIQFIREF